MASNDRQLKFFEFLKAQEEANKSFTINEALQATGWKKATFSAYWAKGQLSDFVSQNDDGDLEASNTLNITFKQFEKSFLKVNTSNR